MTLLSVGRYVQNAGPRLEPHQRDWLPDREYAAALADRHGEHLVRIRVHVITLSNPAVASIAGITLSYTTLNQICDDIDDARVYGGIHFRFDQEEGVRLGRNVATYVYKNNLRRVRGPE